MMLIYAVVVITLLLVVRTIYGCTAQIVGEF
jgi:hypothetical protein